jgi:hypothetical protein
MIGDVTFAVIAIISKINFQEKNLSVDDSRANDFIQVSFKNLGKKDA